MAKRRTKKTKASLLPSTDEVVEKTQESDGQMGTMVPKPEADSGTIVPEMETIVSKPDPELKDDTMSTKLKTLDVPLASLRHGYESRRCDVQAMTGKQPEMLRRLTNGLIAEEAKLANGRPVKREQDAIKWLLEQLAE